MKEMLKVGLYAEESSKKHVLKLVIQIAGYYPRLVV